MKVQAIKTSVFKEGENLLDFIVSHVSDLTEESILVVTSKIVALAEGRIVDVNNKKEKEAIIKRESTWSQKILPEWWLTVRDGTVVVNAGIDDSNADGKTILLPEDSFASAEELRKSLCVQYQLQKLGVIITDSRITPLRAGVVGVALGYAGFKGVRDYRGTPDIFGRPLAVTQTNLADALATAAVVLMGEGAESQPLCVIEDAPVEFSEIVDREELHIDPKQDMYRSLFASKTTKRRKK